MNRQRRELRPRACAQRARSALAALGTALALGCFIDTLDGVPTYPGAQIGPGYRTKDGELTALKQTYYTSDAYYEVVEYYGRFIQKEDGWEAEVHGDIAIWRKNMRPEGGAFAAAEPLDPKRVGKLIVVVDEGTRTTIRAFSSHPGT